MESVEKNQSLNFIEQIIEEDLRNNKNEGKVHTRFPPEPNGYLHIGHSKSICLNFETAKKYGGKCNLRFDDTNPVTEEQLYVDSIKEDIRWLGYDWEDREYYASDYFPQLYEFAKDLVNQGKAYVDDQSGEEISATRGTPSQPGKESPFRNRSVEENLELLEGMKAGRYEEGSRVLRAKIDMGSPNMQLRDPVLYRILKKKHHRTGDEWCIYPTYDFAHGQSDSIEGVTHSLCTLEFEVHRPLYNWLLEALEIYHPQQIEFARLNLTYMVTSKRKLKQLVENGLLTGWDDPRMPTISGHRRRGYTPASIRNFCEKIGVSKRDSLIDVGLLENSVREDLNLNADRIFAVLDPIRLTLVNYPEDQEEILSAQLNPERQERGHRDLVFSRHLLIEREDFMEDPPKNYFRLGPGRLVRLKYGYIVKCMYYKKNEAGEITEIMAEYYPESRSGQDTSGLKVKSAIHWLSENYATNCEVRLYDRLFTVENPLQDKDEDFKKYLNPDSLKVISSAKIEKSANGLKPLDKLQFERIGYFCLDRDSSDGKLVFNRVVALRDPWAKLQAKTG